MKRSLEKDAGRYWHLSRYDERVQDQSHWAGSARWPRKRWLEYGEFNLGLARGFFERYAPSVLAEGFASMTALDWGCGGGANMAALCRQSRRMIGVDISSSTLEECARQLDRNGCFNYETVLVDAAHPDGVVEKVGRDSVDFFFSVAVFQHFPSKAYAKQVLKVAADLVRTGGHGLVQVRYFDGSEKLRQKESDYARNVIYMTSFATGEFSALLAETGFTLLGSERDLDGPEDCHEYYFFRR
ncbi:MAG TPA: class I SAM-dependent methyltransferase [Syntrophales bacterium]|nr:class I SAM-dependent methyltransferase [Syntrophales bacterium]